jgi:hypothetical protein
MPRYALPLLVLAVVAVALLLTWLALGRGAGSGEVAVAEQDLAPFARIEVSGAADVVLQKGSGEHVTIETPTRGLRIQAEVRGNTLRITTRDNRRWWSSLFGRSSRRNARIGVTYRNLEALVLSGAVRITAATMETPELRISANGGSSIHIDGLKTQSLRVDGSGALKAELAGEATEQRVAISGAAEYDAERLASTQANVSVSGVGHVVVRVEKALTASISGAGTIEYYGNPEVKEHVSGVGRVKRREASGDTAKPRWHVASWLLGGALQDCFVL